MRHKKVYVFLALVLLCLTGCTTFRGGIVDRKMDLSYTLLKFDVDEPVPSVNNYFIRGVINVVNESQPSTPVQGVKFKWIYDNIETYTTIPVSRVGCDRTGTEVPEFSVIWSREYMKSTGLTWDNLFQTGTTFNPNLLFDNSDYYVNVVFKMNGESCDMLSDLIYRLQ